MCRRYLLIAFAASLALALAPFSARAQVNGGPYEILHDAYAPYVAPGDPLGFPLKVKSVADNPYAFWRGGKDLFFHWCKANTSEWLRGPAEDVIVTHGDLHVGNIGVYAASKKFGDVAFGMVDFDETARLPFQLELLQGVITLRLIAHTNGIEMTPPQARALAEDVVAQYRAGLGSAKNATDLLADEPAVQSLFEKAEKAKYKKELSRYTEDGKFRRAIVGDNGKLKEILRPVPESEHAAFAKAIAEALARDERAARLFRSTDAQWLAKRIRDVTQRSRLGSSGSQGLKKFFVLLNDPLDGVDHDVILYLKQQIPAAAERAGIAVDQSRPPGARYVADAAALTRPRIWLNAWCEMDGQSYWLTLKEPWSDELDFAEVKDREALEHMTAIWGRVAGTAHGREGRAAYLLTRLDAQLPARLDALSTAYLEQLERDYAAFDDDPRVAGDVASVKAFIEAQAPKPLTPPTPAPP